MQACKGSSHCGSLSALYPGRPCSGTVHLYAWHTPYLFWYMSGISGACILDSGTSSFPVCTVGELCCAPVPICGTYSSIHMEVPTGACYLQFPGFTIYHAVGYFTCPVKFQAHGTSVLSLIRRTFSDQNSVELYIVLPIYSWVNCSTRELSHLLTVTTRQGVGSDPGSLA